MKRHIFFIVYISYAAAYVEEATEYIKTFLTQYSRPITFLELGVESRYTGALAAQRDAVGVMYSMRASVGKMIAHKLAATQLSNIVVLNSDQFGTHELETIGRCEHFDVSIIDEETFLGFSIAQALPHLLHLGDYLFCIVSAETAELILKTAQEMAIAVIIDDIANSNKKICRCDSLKKGLDIARWNMYGVHSSNYTRYTICSSFSSKTLRKSSTHTPWIPGINMVTFIGCRGILPTDDDIMRMINRMKKIEHNDLVLGNMIVQGNTLALIDFDDARRYIRQRKCLRLAQWFFKSGIRFNRTPEDALHEYKLEMRK